MNAAVNREQQSQALILVVDDEESIRKTLQDVLLDEGYAVELAVDGASALELLKRTRPALILLDIWMPGLDGMETLRQLKLSYPDIPVVMISGHATIATAMQATRIGASNFIEKPLDLESTLRVIQTALQVPESAPGMNPGSEQKQIESQHSLSIGSVWKFSELNTLVFDKQNMRGRALPQRTLAASTLLYGQGLHSGTKSGLILEPLPANSGIHFVGVADGQPVPAHVSFVHSTGFATSLRHQNTQVGTIEHLLSALCAYGISNLLIKCNGEVPVMDGSSAEFCALFEETGIEEQVGDWFEIKIDRTVEVRKGEEFIRIEPADSLSIEYRLKYPEPVGEQCFSFVMSDAQAYKREISRARTFGFVKDIGMLQKKGLAQGGRFDNFVLIGDEGVINDELRYPNEPVRHKILDAIGDLYLLGRPLCGKITACMTGHSDNIELLQKIYRLMQDDD